jgi:hypothetical protein
VLVLSLMVLLVLTAIALVAVQAVMNFMSRTGSWRISRVANGITTAGSEATMAVAAQSPAGFNQFLQTHAFRLNMGDVSPAFFDMTAGGSFGVEVANVNSAGWVSLLANPISSHRAPGYALGEFCFRKYTSLTSGTFRNDTDATVSLDRNADKQYVATIFVGPVVCE